MPQWIKLNINKIFKYNIDSNFSVVQYSEFRQQVSLEDENAMQKYNLYWKDNNKKTVDPKDEFKIVVSNQHINNSEINVNDIYHIQFTGIADQNKHLDDKFMIEGWCNFVVISKDNNEYFLKQVLDIQNPNDEINKINNAIIYDYIHTNILHPTKIVWDKISRILECANYFLNPNNTQRIINDRFLLCNSKIILDGLETAFWNIFYDVFISKIKLSIKPRIYNLFQFPNVNDDLALNIKTKLNDVFTKWQSFMTQFKHDLVTINFIQMSANSLANGHECPIAENTSSMAKWHEAINDVKSLIGPHGEIIRILGEYSITLMH